jgi:hypothetical protein
MKTGPAWPTMILLIALSGLACRDSGLTAASAVGGPSFAVTTDTVPGGCAQPAKQCHFTTRGEAANVSWFDPGTAAVSDTGGGGTLVRYGFLSVGRGGSRDNPEAFLDYQITECDASFTLCTAVRGGFGVIPAADLTGNTKALQLRTSTSDNPNFFTYAGPAGLIAADWVNNGLFEQQFNGTTHRTQPGFLEFSVGRSIDVSANASGTIVGLSILPANSANISTSQGVTIDINH